jgi:hypothetical protein
MIVLNFQSSLVEVFYLQHLALPQMHAGIHTVTGHGQRHRDDIYYMQGSDSTYWKALGFAQWQIG